MKFKYIQVKAGNIPYTAWYSQVVGEVFEVVAEKHVKPYFSGYLLSPHYPDSPYNYVHDADKGSEFGAYGQDYGIREECCEELEMTRDEFIDWRIQFECKKIHEKYGRE